MECLSGCGVVERQKIKERSRTGPSCYLVDLGRVVDPLNLNLNGPPGLCCMGGDTDIVWDYMS